METGTVTAAVKNAPSPPRTAATNAPMIAVRGLTKKIGRQEILRGIDLTVAKGETLVIIGRSGGGKSVLLKHLIGLLLPDEGEIWIDGQNIIGLNERKLAAIRRKIGILFQGGALFDSMTVEENIAFPLREAGERDPKVIREKVKRAIGRIKEFKPYHIKTPVQLDVRFKSYRPSEMLSYLSIVERTDSHSIRFMGKDIVEVSKFLEFITSYEPSLEP